MLESRMKKFLCDQMCINMGHWLRIAGYDTAIVEASMSDKEIFKKAVSEKRLILTRDKSFQALDLKGDTILYLKSSRLDDWAELLKEKAGVNWLFCPFSRCLRCNSLLNKTPPPYEGNAKIPLDIADFWICQTCNQLFWRGSHTKRMQSRLEEWQNKTSLTFGLGGDLMIGRLLNEYLDINHVPFSYVWGDLLPVLKSTDFNFANLETTLTHSQKKVSKIFNFKATPDKVAVLTEAGIEAVNGANNHILDFSEEGLLETLQVLDKANIFHVGAGKDLKSAQAPCIIEKKGIKIGFLGCTDNEPSWKATSSHSGTNYVEVGDLNSIQQSILELRQQVDFLVLSIHWGPNMSQRPPSSFSSFAHKLIDLGVDILHGHSAHIFQGVEIYKDRLILYDTGDFIDDYAVDPILRNDRSFFFIVSVDKKRMVSLKMVPLLISNFQVNIAHENEHLNKMKMLCKELKTHLRVENNSLVIDLRQEPISNIL